MQRLDLAAGYSISRVIKGGWQLAGGHGPVDREVAVRDMFHFVDEGITTFDCADIYTGVEETIGEFLKRLRRERGASAAAGVQVHTKFVPDRQALSTMTREDVEGAVDRSLCRLGVERLDLVQFHWWDYDVPRFVEVAAYLGELRRAGKIRHIGLTNFDVPALWQILEAGVPLVSHQVQYSVIDRRPERGMVEICRTSGVRLLCYGTVAGGFLSERYLGAAASEPPFENRSLVKYALIIEEFGGWALFQTLLAALHAIGRRHGVTIGAVAIRWILDREQVGAAIVGARHARHLDGTLRAFSFALGAEDHALLASVTDLAKGPAGDVYALERVKGGRHASIMKYGLNAAGRE